jgi:hypothetical protein
MRSSNVFSIAVGLILGTAVAYLVSKKYSKISKEVEEQEQKESRELEDAGITEEVLRTSSSAEEDSRSMVERIHNTVRHSTVIDEDIFDSTKALEAKAVVHVTESIFENKYSQIDFIFEVPNPSEEENSYKYPKTREYKEMIDKLSKGICERCLVKTFTRLEGYVVLIIGDENKKETIIRRIPSSWYEKFRKQRCDGFVEYYETFMKDETGAMEKELIETFKKEVITNNDEDLPVVFVDLLMAWRISVPIQHGRRGNGINEINAIQCINYIVDNATAKRDHGETVNFKNFLFHPFEEITKSHIDPRIINEDGVIESLEY